MVGIHSVRKGYRHLRRLSLQAEHAQFPCVVVIPFQNGDVVGIIRLTPEIVLGREDILFDRIQSLQQRRDIRPGSWEHILFKQAGDMVAAVFLTGIEQGGALEALDVLRAALDGIEATEVTDAAVKAYKEWLKNDLTYRMKSPNYWVNAISRRQLEGKDFTTDYKARIDAVNTAKVKQILSSLNNASKVEYIIRTK